MPASTRVTILFVGFITIFNFELCDNYGGICSNMASSVAAAYWLGGCHAKFSGDLTFMFLDRSRGCKRRRIPGLVAFAAASLMFGAYTTLSAAQPQELTLQFAPAETRINFTIGDILHTIHGSFRLKRGEVGYALAAATVRGVLVVDATSGQSGNRSRDRKMHREILESNRYPEITFRPDRGDGKVAPAGTSMLQVHGIFSIHGSDHELTMPVQVQMFPDHWIADTHFTVPYVKWGIKNPSTFVLRVSESVEIEVHATGATPFINSGTH